MPPGGLGALLNNPALLGMASQVMQNPAFASMYVVPEIERRCNGQIALMMLYVLLKKMR
jgi:hypothetical protein